MGCHRRHHRHRHWVCVKESQCKKKKKEKKGSINASSSHPGNLGVNDINPTSRYRMAIKSNPAITPFYTNWRSLVIYSVDISPTDKPPQGVPACIPLRATLADLRPTACPPNSGSASLLRRRCRSRASLQSSEPFSFPTMRRERGSVCVAGIPNCARSNEVRSFCSSRMRSTACAVSCCLKREKTSRYACVLVTILPCPPSTNQTNQATQGWRGASLVVRNLELPRFPPVIKDNRHQRPGLRKRQAGGMVEFA